MSIDIDIFPTISRNFCWGELKKKLLELLALENIQNLDNFHLIKLVNSEKVAESEIIFMVDGQDYINYYLSFGIHNKIRISVSKNNSNYIDEFEYLDDYGRNLDTATIKALSQDWKSVGYVYGIANIASRNNLESRLPIILATAMAYLCQGCIIVTSSDFTFDIGVYTPEEFQQAKII